MAACAAMTVRCPGADEPRRGKTRGFGHRAGAASGQQARQGPV